SLHSLYTTLAVGSTSLPSTAQNPKYFQSSLFRFLGVTITFSAAVKLDSALSASRKSTVSSDSARQCDSCDLSLISGARPPAKQTVLPLFLFFYIRILIFTFEILFLTTIRIYIRI